MWSQAISMALPYLKMKKYRKFSFTMKNRKVVRKLFHDSTQNLTSYTVTNIEVTKCKVQISEQMIVHEKISDNPKITFASTPKKNSKLPEVKINVGTIETLCDFPDTEERTIEFCPPDFPASEEESTIEFCPPELVDTDLDANSDGINEKILPAWLYNQN